jgi:predicted HTH domain antitoxin
MEIRVEVPSTLLDALQCTPEEFTREAKMAMAAKLYELKRLSSGMAAQLAGMNRVEFLHESHRYGVAVIDLSEDDLASDLEDGWPSAQYYHGRHDYESRSLPRTLLELKENAG